MARYTPLLKTAGRVRRLTNNPERASDNWTQLTPGRHRVVLPRPQIRNRVRRLMKLDMSNAQGTPDSQLLGRANGEAGASGPSRGVRVLGRSETKRTAEARSGATQATSRTGVRSIRDRSPNRGIIRR